MPLEDKQMNIHKYLEKTAATKRQLRLAKKYMGSG